MLESAYVKNITKGKKIEYDNLELLTDIIELIENNNEATLIGTLNFMNFNTILNPEYLHLTCSETFDKKQNKYIADILDISKY